MTMECCCPEIATPSSPSPNDLAAAYRPLARKIARQIYDTLPEDGIHEFDDLFQAGLLGLLRAAHSYKPDRGVGFHAYARHRVRGEILDHLRRLDVAPRGLRQWQRHAAEASLRLRLTLGREPSAEETAEALGLDVEDSRELARNLQNVFCLTDDLQVVDSSEIRASESSRQDATRPDTAWEQAQVRKLLLAAIDGLAPREREIISLHYLEERSLPEIGRRIGIHVSRVFQLRNRALERIGERLRVQGIETAMEMMPVPANLATD